MPFFKTPYFDTNTVVVRVETDEDGDVNIYLSTTSKQGVVDRMVAWFDNESGKLLLSHIPDNDMKILAAAGVSFVRVNGKTTIEIDAR